MFGVVPVISVGSTVAVLVLDRLFPGARGPTIAGPLPCVGAVLAFNKIDRDWFWAGAFSPAAS